MIKVQFRSKLKAIATVEVVLALSLFGLIVIGVAGGLFFSVQSNFTSSVVNQGTYLVDEGFEALKNIKDTSFASLTDGTHGLSSAGSSWALSGSSDANGIFTRNIIISTVDSYTKQVTVNVSWPSQFTGANSISQSMYLTNWDRFVSVGPSWATPSIQASLNLTGTVDVIRMAQQGNYIYAIRASGTGNFVVIDVSNPASPVVSGSLSLTNTLTDIAVSGNYAYVTGTGNSSEVQIVNITNPASPTLAFTYNMAGNGNGQAVVINGNNMMIARSIDVDPEFYNVNITNPLAPVITGSFQSAYAFNRLVFQGNYVYASSADNSREFVVINNTTLATPSVAATVDYTGNTDGGELLAFSTDRLIFSRKDGSLEVLNTTTPTAPTLIGSYNAGAEIRDIDIGNSNNYLFLGTLNATQEFQVVDITTQSSPVQLSVLNLNGALNAVTYSSTPDRAFGGGSNLNPEILVFQPN